MRRPYDSRPTSDGLLWLVYDVETNEVATIDGRACQPMTMEEADDLADFLNWQERERHRPLTQ